MLFPRAADAHQAIGFRRISGEWMLGTQHFGEELLRARNWTFAPNVPIYFA
jgi:hypothetical protein